MQDYPTADGSDMIAEEGQRLSTRVLTQFVRSWHKRKSMLPRIWRLVCAQLCGGAHYSMRGTIIVHDTQEAF